MLFFPLLFSVAFYLYVYGAHTLGVHNLYWLFKGDTATHFLGSAFFLQSSWTFPLGQIADFLPGLNTSVVATDSIPTAAILMKLLFGRPAAPFQFTGPWLLLCYLLQGYWGFRLIYILTKNARYSALAACFFVLSPVLLFRADHKALCAHWLILWTTYLYAWAAENRRAPWAALLFANMLSIGIHPYLGPMVFLITIATYGNLLLQQGRQLLVRSLGQIFGILSGVLLHMYVLGFFLIQSPGAGGFALFSTDLLAFFNSMDNSSLIPKIRYSSSQQEGFAYLGLGMIALLLLNIFFRLKCSPASPHTAPSINTKPLVIAGLLAFMFALSSHISFGGNTLLTLEWFYQALEPLPSTFRASGRFVWPLYYILTTIILWRTFKLLPYRRAMFVVGAMLALQMADMHKLYAAKEERVPRPTPAELQLASPFWETLREKGLRRLFFVPPILPGSEPHCSLSVFTPDEYWALAIKAVQNRMSINSGYVARFTLPADHCAKFWADVPTADHGNDIFVVIDKDDYRARLQKLLAQRKDKFHCQKIDGFHVCMEASKF